MSLNHSPALFQNALRRNNLGRPPVWFMRQAGRYHSHYQALKQRHSFMELCKSPELACEVTLGPIQDFKFDAAILFSDLLFPLEVLGMGLDYSPSPKLSWHLKERSDLARLTLSTQPWDALNFQAEALKKIRAALPVNVGLLGFVGGPLTLFYYAASGSHQGDLTSAHSGMKDGRFEGFCEILYELLAQNMTLQARAGADTVAIFDTCAGDVNLDIYRSKVVPALTTVITRFHSLCPGVPVTYYSKNTGAPYWRELEGLPISCLGVDAKNHLPDVINEFGSRYAVQGNFNQEHFFLPLTEFREKMYSFFDQMTKIPSAKRSGWICGLGHGVIPKTPEAHVREFVATAKEVFK